MPREKKPIRWLVTAGPTCEDIDPVRFISNRSSGAMGHALAAAARARGDVVALVTGPVALPPPEGVAVDRVRSTREMYDAVMARLDTADVVVMAAAVADYRPARASATKLKKTGGTLALELEETEDILAEVGRRKGARVVVGFALESPEPGDDAPITAGMRANAQGKFERKSLDLVVLNGPSAISAGASTVSLLDASGVWRDLGEAAKERHAEAIVEAAARIAAGRDPA
jgi:phosphopantothenoylcysteine decarboxylase/phosphopantothenate--cysteine ligase